MEPETETVRTVCEWFAKCANRTTQGVIHPSLGLTPCCRRCAAYMEVSDRLIPLFGVTA